MAAGTRVVEYSILAFPRHTDAHRGAAVCIQVTTNSTYSKPTNDQIPV
jgi:hypothetical protein